MAFGAMLRRLVGLLGPEKRLAGRLALANGAVAVAMLAEPVLFGRVVDALARGTGAGPLIALWALLGVAGAAAAIAVAFEADRLAHRRRLAAIGMFFGHVLSLPQHFHGERHSGQMLRVMLAGADNLFGFWLAVLREHLAGILGLMLLVPVAFSLDARLSGLLLALAVLYAAANVAVIRHTHAAQARVERQHAAVAGRATDVVANVAVVQSFTRVQAEMGEMRRMMDQLLSAQVPVLRWWALLTVLTRTAATLTVVAVLALGTTLHARGETSVGEIVSFVGFATLMIGKLEQISGFGAQLFFQLRPIADFLAVLDEQPGPPELPGARPLPAGSATVRFEDVSFTYPGSGVGVHNFDVTVEPGSTVALVGSTGAGKSTALALLRRAADPDAGRITIGGMDIREATLESLRGAISVVFQEASLFNRSIAENIALGRPGAGMAEIEAAARRAQAHDFIAAKPDGYMTVVAERGANLSGGERQRIAIARAFLKDAPILVLDEATSALDAETEAQVQAALADLAQGRTVFVIAHRLSTVRAADVILVLERGRIVERGRFDELARAGGAFARYAAAGGFAVAG